MWGEHLFTLFMLILLQAVLGFDNLLYISLESKRAPESEQQRVRVIGIGLAIILRLGLLFLLVSLQDAFKADVFGLDNSFISAHFNIDSIITLLGGGFIIYTAIKEIFHMIGVDKEHNDSNNSKTASVANVITWILIMNLVFSFDSILSAISLANGLEYSFVIMAIAIVVSGVLMIVMAKTVSEFLKKNRLYEILGLFILFIVGIMLITEGGHKAHLSFFGNEIHAMSKTTFYFVIFVLVAIDIIQGKFQKKMLER